MKNESTILVLNSGSSSLKFGLYAADASGRVLLSGSAEGIGKSSGSLHIRDGEGRALVSKESVHESQEEALQAVALALADHLHTRPAAVGHRIVHGGPKLQEHQLITDALVNQMEEAIHFAPLHIPVALQLLKLARRIFDDAPHFACFDTVFHRTMPEVAKHLPLPRRYFEQGVMRYGFHGLSYESIVHRLGAEIPQRCVFAHLGNGASVCAVLEGRSIDTSMGMTPTGGVPMGTRCGDLDPGVLVYLLRAQKLDADAMEDLLNRESGLKALSDGDSDMQSLLASTEPAAWLAVEGFTLAVRKQVAAYAALMGGLDLLVFTGGIGEHAAAVRQAVCDGLGFLGLAESGKRVMVLPAQEELQIARHCRRLMAEGAVSIV